MKKENAKIVIGVFSLIIIIGGILFFIGLNYNPGGMEFGIYNVLSLFIPIVSIICGIYLWKEKNLGRLMICILAIFSFIWFAYSFYSMISIFNTLPGQNPETKSVFFIITFLIYSPLLIFSILAIYFFFFNSTIKNIFQSKK
jgi:hypothetical protein